MTIRDRIKELRRVPASELRAHPQNWREHPLTQRTALESMLEDVGFAGALLARETPEGLCLLDGHLRAEIAGDALVPVLILDVTEEEGRKLLATFDPIGAMAEANRETLAELVRGLPDLDSFLTARLEGEMGNKAEPQDEDEQPDGEDEDPARDEPGRTIICPKCGGTIRL